MGKLFSKKNLGILLSLLGGSGVVVTSIMTAKATIKAIPKLEEVKKNSEEPLTKLRTVQIVGTTYIPSVLFGLSTIGCIFGASILNCKQQASLAGAYALLQETHKRYRKAACDVFGEDADNKIKVQMAKEQYISSYSFMSTCNLYIPDKDKSDKALFYDIHSKTYFTSTLAAVINAQYHINRNISLGDEVSLADYYEFLGIDEEASDEIGWDIAMLVEGYGCSWLDFDNELTVMDDGMECYVITTEQEPLSFEHWCDELYAQK